MAIATTTTVTVRQIASTLKRTVPDCWVRSIRRARERFAARRRSCSRRRRSSEVSCSKVGLELGDALSHLHKWVPRRAARTVAKDLAKLTFRSHSADSRRGSTRIPKPFPAFRRGPLKFFEPMRETVVWMEGERAGEPAAEQLDLEEARAGRSQDPDVGEQAPVDVTRFDPDQQPHPPPFDVRCSKAEARGPKHWTGVSGLTVSGVSTPITRTVSTSPPSSRTSSVSPSTARTTTAAQVLGRRLRAGVGAARTPRDAGGRPRRPPAVRGSRVPSSPT